MTVPALTVGWTLCFEMLFYACAALVLVNRRWAFAIIGIYGIAFVLRPIGPTFQFLGNPLILEFLFGVAICYIPGWRPGILAIPIGTILLVGAALFGEITFLGSAESILRGDACLQRVLVFGLPAAMIVYGTLQVHAQKSVWTYFGDASYSLYLTHTYPLTVLLILWKKFFIPADLIILISISVAVVFAWRIHEAFEKPVITALKRRSMMPVMPPVLPQKTNLP
jgi:exopolysaccharide production protein ExoZ